MTTRDPNPAPRNNPEQGKLPLDAAEALLAELVEGDLAGLAPSAEQVARLTPKHRKLLEALRRDRQVLAGIPDVAAPAGLCDAVMARLERESLFEDPFAAEKLSTDVLLTAEQFERQLASREFSEREALVGGSLSGRFQQAGPAGAFRTRGLIAAGVLLVLGGGLYLASLTMTGNGPGQLAINDTKPTPPVANHSGANSGATPDSPSLATNTKPESPAPADITPVEPAPIRVAMETSRPTTAAKSVINSSIAAAFAAADGSRVIDGPDAPERALKAAREGRLIIRVRSSDPEQARARLASIASEKQPDARTWRLSTASQPEIIAAATRAVPSIAERIAAEREQFSRARQMASALAETGQPTSAMLNIAPAEPRFDPREHGGVFLLDVVASDKAIGLAKTVLAGTLLGKTPGLEPAADAIELVELENSVPSLPSTQVEAVMWWTQPPKDWIAHASVPVVIEEK